MSSWSQRLKPVCWFIDRVEIWRPTRRKMGRFGDDLLGQSVGQYTEDAIAEEPGRHGASSGGGTCRSGPDGRSSSSDRECGPRCSPCRRSVPAWRASHPESGCTAGVLARVQATTLQRCCRGSLEPSGGPLCDEDGTLKENAHGATSRLPRGRGVSWC